MNLTPESFHSLFNKKSNLHKIIVLGLLLVIASCSTKGLSSRIKTYPEQTGKRQNNKDLNIEYREDRLNPKDRNDSDRKLDFETLTKSETITDSIGFADDLDKASLEKVIINQLQAMFEQEPATPVRLGEFTLSRGRLIKTLEAFLQLLRQDLSLEEFNRKLTEDFIPYRVGKRMGKSKKMLFTGYYRPVIQASLVKTAIYRYPLYRMQDPGMQKVVKYKSGIKLVGTQSGIKRTRESFKQKAKKDWRGLTRKEIDAEGALEGKGLEVAWLKDDLERFFLHIQGSGILKFPDGTRQGVGYQGSNKYSYTGIGKLMIQDGVIKTSQGSMQGIKKYFADNPQDISKYLYQNKRYIFFTFNDQGPRGSGGGELVGGRSIATDKSIYPAGGLVFIKVKQPVLDENNEIIRWKPISRFVIDQDTGSAIRGPGRADLFFGTGEKAGVKAGHYHELGEVFYLVKKD